MKIHFGFFYNDGDYESPIGGCDETICGYDGEEVLEKYTTEIWEDVSCKKCLRLQDAIISGHKAEEEAIINQMGDMADFFEKECQAVK